MTSRLTLFIFPARVRYRNASIAAGDRAFQPEAPDASYHAPVAEAAVAVMTGEPEQRVGATIGHAVDAAFVEDRSRDRRRINVFESRNWSHFGKN